MKMLKNNQKGIALMAVLWVLVILIALATEFAYSMKTEVNTTRNYKENAESYFLSKAGINLALAELFKDARFHSIHEEYGWITGKILPLATGAKLPSATITQDKTGIPPNEDGSVPETRKKLLRILEKKKDDWVEVSGEVYDYFEERIFIENNIEANRRPKEQFMIN